MSPSVARRRPGPRPRAGPASPRRRRSCPRRSSAVRRSPGPAAYAAGPRRSRCSRSAGAWSRQTNVRWSLRTSAPGSRCDSHSTWKPLQMPSTGRPAAGRVDQRAPSPARTGRWRRSAGSRRRRSRRAGPPRRRRAGRRRRATARRPRPPARRTARAASRSSSEPGKVTTPTRAPSAIRPASTRTVKSSITGLESRVSAAPRTWASRSRSPRPSTSSSNRLPWRTSVNPSNPSRGGRRRRPGPAGRGSRA